MEKTQKKTIRDSIISFLFFLAIGIITWQTNKHIFFLFNFMYIGLAVAVGELLFGLLPKRKRIWGRRISQLLIGTYMVGVLGFLGRENMQIEGFFFYLLAGVFSGPVLHYFIAKIAGTFLFGRGWCGWACWTAMILDFLPWSKPQNGRLRKLGLLRYLHFILVMTMVFIFWFIIDIKGFHQSHATAFRWLLIGNLAYYAVGIVLAAILKDNRAFCKYICPIPTVMKPGAHFSVMKFEIDSEKCTRCGLCEKNCPMNIKLLSYLKDGKRITSTECIACQQCVNNCPQEAVRYTSKLDFGRREFINYK